LSAWEIIGGRLDFVNFVGTNDQPPRSGPGVAQKLQHVYQKYLMLFDHTYLRSVLAKQMSQQRSSAPPVQGPPAAPGGGNGAPPNLPSNGIPATTQQPASATSNFQALAARLGTNDPTKIGYMLQLSFISTDDLRKRGVSTEIINVIDAHRPILNRFAQAQTQLRNAKNSQNSNQLLQGQRTNEFGLQLRNPAQGTISVPPGVPGMCLLICVGSLLTDRLGTAFQQSTNGPMQRPMSLVPPASRYPRPSTDAFHAAEVKINQWKQAAQAQVQRRKCYL
jgi:hypothetical protein